MSERWFTSDKLSNDQVDAIEGAHDSHHALAKAQTHLEHALGSAQTGREKSWADEVALHLKKARELISAHRKEVQRPHGLYAEIEFEAPHLSPKIKSLVEELKDVEKAASNLAEDVEAVSAGDNREILDIRPHADAMLTELRRLMATESDLVFERFNEPPALD